MRETSKHPIWVDAISELSEVDVESLGLVPLHGLRVSVFYLPQVVKHEGAEIMEEEQIENKLFRVG